MTDGDLIDFVDAYNKRDIKASRVANEKLPPPAALLTAIELLFREINDETSLIERVISIDDWVGSDIVLSAQLAARAITLRHEQLSDDEFEATSNA